MRSLLLAVALAGTAYAAPVTVTGQVTEVNSRWTSDGSRIVTEATVRTDAGAVVVSQLGGSVDGIAMRSFPGPALLAPGMRVTVGVRQAEDLSARPHNVVETVKVLAAPPGYVRTGTTKAGRYLYWESGCVFVAIDAAGTKEVAGDLEFEVIDASIAAWNDGVASCSYMNLVSSGPRQGSGGAAAEVGRDNVNLIKFRDQSWCRPATQDDPARCHPESAAGITTATYVDDETSERDGAIVDADVELNGVQFAISVAGQSQGTRPCLADLQNTLTHELGHLLGLEHTCLTAADPPRLDDDGRAVPLCSVATDPAITGATMFNFQDCGETKKATLEADDVAGVCGIYPKADDPGSCEPVGDAGGCCQTGSSATPTGSLLLSMLAGLGLFAGCWRRRR